jgi:hypothetical protein
LRAIPWLDPTEQGNGKLSVGPSPAVRTCIAQDGSGVIWQEAVAPDDEDVDADTAEEGLKREEDDDWDALEGKKICLSLPGTTLVPEELYQTVKYELHANTVLVILPGA